MIAAFATRLFAVAGNVMHDLTAAGGMADMNGVFQIEMRC
jgi:hypothetical protein